MPDLIGRFFMEKIFHRVLQFYHLLYVMFYPNEILCSFLFGLFFIYTSNRPRSFD